MTMRATREALDACECPSWAVNTDAALAEVAVFERIAEAARELTDKPFGSLDFRAFYRVREALADLDRLRGQTGPMEFGAGISSLRSACPCDGGEGSGCVCQ